MSLRDAVRNWLENDLDAQARRQLLALAIGLFAALFAGLYADYLFGERHHIPMYDEFPEWREGNGDPSADAPPETNRAYAPGLIQHFRDLWSRLNDTFDDYANSLRPRHVAGVSRFWAIWFTALIVPLSYRQLLMPRDVTRDHAVPQTLVEFLLDWALLALSRVMIAVVAVAGCYLVQSALWVLLADMFEDLKLSHGSAVVIVALTVGTTGFIVAHWALAVTTRGLFTFSLLTLVVGLSGGFAIAGTRIYTDPATGEIVISQWWEHAISETGQTPNASLFFTCTLVSFSVIMMIFWNDFYQIMRKVLAPVLSEKSDPAPSLWRFGAWVRWKACRIVALVRLRRADVDLVTARIGCGLYVTLLGLVLIGLVRISERDTLTHIVTQGLHGGGVGVAAGGFVVGGMFALTPWLHHKGIFPAYFTWLAILLGVGLVALGVLLALHTMRGFGILTLTGFEFAAFAIIGIWLIQAVDLVLDV